MLPCAPNRLPWAAGRSPSRGAVVRSGGAQLSRVPPRAGFDSAELDPGTRQGMVVRQESPAPAGYGAGMAVQRGYDWSGPRAVGLGERVEWS